MEKCNIYGYVNANKVKITPYKKLICDRGYSNKILVFPDRLNGETEFGIVFDETTNPTIKISSCERVNCGLFCIDPYYVVPNFSPSISQEDKLIINLVNQDDLIILTPISFRMNESSNIKELFINTNDMILVNSNNFFAKKISAKNNDNIIVLKNVGRFSIME